MTAALPDRFSAGKRQFWREFLALYQGMPELWDAHHVNYRNKELRNRAYELLETKLREIQPNATRTEVGRRINIFRTNYRREQMRILKQKELGLHSDLCKPTLWFYDYMGFLLTQETFQHRTRKGRASTGNGRQKIHFRFAKEVSADPPDSVCDWPMKDSSATNFLPEPATTQPEEASLLSPKVEIIEADEGNATHRMEPSADLKEEASMTNIPGSTESAYSTQPDPGNGRAGAQNQSLSESSEVLAKSWAIQYEEMAPTQRILARKAIADILFEGCMGNLRINRGDPRNSVGSI